MLCRGAEVIAMNKFAALVSIDEHRVRLEKKQMKYKLPTWFPERVVMWSRMPGGRVSVLSIICIHRDVHSYLPCLRADNIDVNHSLRAFVCVWIFKTG